MRWEVSGSTTAVLWSFTSRTCSKQHTAPLCCSHLAFCTNVSLDQVVHPYSSTDMATAWKNSHFISLDGLNLHIIDNLSIAVYALPMYILTLLSVDGILLPRYVNWSTNFRGLPFYVEMAPSWHEFYFMWVHAEANISCCSLQAMQQDLQKVLDHLSCLHL